MKENSQININQTLRLLNIVKDSSALSLRIIAGELGISLSRASRLIEALLGEGLIKLVEVQRGYDLRRRKAYSVTEQGIRYRLSHLQAYVDRRTREYVLLGEELSSLRGELEKNDFLAHPVTPWRRSRSKTINRLMS